MDIALVTGSSGLIGSASVRRFAREGLKVVGIDNDMRSYFFGGAASTKWVTAELKEKLPEYRHHDVDIRDVKELREIFATYSSDIKVAIHTAAQPSHDWASKEPTTDFSVNATGTLNLLEMTRNFCPEAVFIFTSTNKVYGDRPNSLPIVEKSSRWELSADSPFFEHGIDESMSVDACTHSLFGVSKVAADLMVQEYGRYFGLKTVSFRGGCLTGPAHAGAELHGFLAYLMRCVVTKSHYSVFGYKGKQVRDNIYCDDLVDCFWHVYRNPRVGEVYNIGGGRFANCSMIEAIRMCEEISSSKLSFSYEEKNRIGDHIWWVSDVRKFRSHYPEWNYRYDIFKILVEIHDALVERLRAPGAAGAQANAVRGADNLIAA